MTSKLTLKQYITSSGKYPEREKFTDEQVIINAEALLEKINALLEELGVDISKVSVSSGFRPADVNAKIANAAKRSSHMIGNAIDLLDDKDQTLAKLILSKHELLKKYGLWIEDPDYTKGNFTNWVHLDVVQRSARDVQKFKP